MGVLFRPNRFFYCDPDNPKHLAQCDWTGYIVRHEDLRKQYAWRGDSIEWTGLMVHKDYVSRPDEQTRTPPTPQNMKPVENPRGYVNQYVTEPVPPFPDPNKPFPPR